MSYNATVYTDDGGVCVAELDSKGFILRSNAAQCTGLEGSRAYDAYFRKYEKPRRIDADNCDGYRRALKGLALPPLYRGV